MASRMTMASDSGLLQGSAFTEIRWGRKWVHLT